MPQKITNIAVHHFAGRLSYDQVNALHKSEWPDAPSELKPGCYVGYNFIIWTDGSWLQTRYIGEETCAQVGHNFDTVSISLYGDFSQTQPTAAQVETLKRFLVKLTSGDLADLAVKPGTVIKIPRTNIYPHRVLQPHHTECYGSLLDDKWAMNLLLAAVIPSPPPSTEPVAALSTPLPLQTSGPEWTRLMQAYQKLLNLWYVRTGQKVGGMCMEGVRG